MLGSSDDLLPLHIAAHVAFVVAPWRPTSQWCSAKRLVPRMLKAPLQGAANGRGRPATRSPTKSLIGVVDPGAR